MVVAVVFANGAAVVIFVAAEFVDAAAAHQMSCIAATVAEGIETEAGSEPGFLVWCEESFAVIEVALAVESGSVIEEWIC